MNERSLYMIHKTMQKKIWHRKRKTSLTKPRRRGGDNKYVIFRALSLPIRSNLHNSQYQVHKWSSSEFGRAVGCGSAFNEVNNAENVTFRNWSIFIEMFKVLYTSLYQSYKRRWLGLYLACLQYLLVLFFCLW